MRLCVCVCVCVCVRERERERERERDWDGKIKSKSVADAKVMLSLCRKGSWNRTCSYKAKAKTSQKDCYCEHLLSYGNDLRSGCIITILHPITSWRWNMSASVMFIPNQKSGDDYGNDVGWRRELISGEEGKPRSRTHVYSAGDQSGELGF